MPLNLGVEPLIIIIWLQGTDIYDILTFWWLTWPMTLTDGVTLTLKHRNNGTNGFPVSENVGVKPLFGFISGQVTEIWHIVTFWWLTMTYDIDPVCDLDLEWKNNATNAFPVPENLGVEPLFVFVWWLVMAHFHFLHYSCGGHFEYEN